MELKYWIERIEQLFGPRCPDYEPDCPCCFVWALLDWAREQRTDEPELFIGMEETNMELFASNCCNARLSLEPLCRVVCSYCKKALNDEQAWHYNPGCSECGQPVEAEGCVSCNECNRR